MTPRPPVRIGLIGAGYIAGYHIEGLRAAGAEVRVISARSAERASAAALRWSIPEATGDWREVIARRDIEAVVITTPDDTHAPIAIAATQAGKHILLQKPMAPSAEDCRRIIRAADEARVHLQVSFMHRYFEEVVKARQLIAEGAIGRPLAVRMRNATPGPDWDAWFYRRERVPGGVVMQLGVHGIDLLRHMFGDITFLTSQAMLLRKERQLRDGTVVQPDNDDNALAIYRFASGMVGTHEMSMSEVQGCDRFTMEIYGDEGTIWLRTVRGPLALYALNHTGRNEWLAPELPSRAFGERHHRAFIDIVRGDAAPDATGIDGLATVLVADAIFRSSEARKEVRVPSPTEVEGDATP